MAKFTLEITLGNDAMQTTEDIADALQRTASKLESGYRTGNIMDLNGNSVGSYAIED